MGRTLLWALALFVVAGAAAIAFILFTGRGAVAHLDPAQATPKGSPNWAFAAPASSSTPHKTLDAPLFATEPLALIDAFEAIALAEPKTERVDDGGGDAVWRSYVQRSKLVSFPDYISVRAVEVETPQGPRASLLVYSRSVYGYSDLGVNGARVERWLTALREATPLVD